MLRSLASSPPPISPSWKAATAIRAKRRPVSRSTIFARGILISPLLSGSGSNSLSRGSNAASCALFRS